MQITLASTIDFVKETLRNVESGHDWWHIYRVWKNACAINKTESGNECVVELAALLHDIADAKFHNGNEEKGALVAQNFLITQELNKDDVEHICNIIRYISFKGGITDCEFSSPEFSIVQDADRLDAMGAIGIARTFNYGGYRNREIFNPEILPVQYETSDQYRKSEAPTINHFYEKLLKLKDLMNTSTGKKMAEQRHQFMLNYLKQFYAEWPSDEPTKTFRDKL